MGCPACLQGADHSHTSRRLCRLCRWMAGRRGGVEPLLSPGCGVQLRQGGHGSPSVPVRWFTAVTVYRPSRSLPYPLRSRRRSRRSCTRSHPPGSSRPRLSGGAVPHTRLPAPRGPSSLRRCTPVMHNTVSADPCGALASSSARLVGRGRPSQPIVSSRRVTVRANRAAAVSTGSEDSRSMPIPLS